jgi:hypothetical protein
MVRLEAVRSGRGRELESDAIAATDLVFGGESHTLKEVGVKLGTVSNMVPGASFGPGSGVLRQEFVCIVCFKLDSVSSGVPETASTSP